MSFSTSVCQNRNAPDARQGHFFHNDDDGYAAMRCRLHDRARDRQTGDVIRCFGDVDRVRLGQANVYKLKQWQP